MIFPLLGCLSRTNLCRSITTQHVKVEERTFKNSNGDIAVLRGNLLVLTLKNETGQTYDQIFDEYTGQNTPSFSGSTLIPETSSAYNQRARSRSLSYAETEYDRKFSATPFPDWHVKRESECDEVYSLSTPPYSEWKSKSEADRNVDNSVATSLYPVWDTDMDLCPSEDTLSDASGSLPGNEVRIAPHFPSTSEVLDGAYFSLSPLSEMSDLPEEDGENRREPMEGWFCRSLSPLTPPPDDRDSTARTPLKKHAAEGMMTRAKASQNIKDYKCSTARPKRHR